MLKDTEVPTSQKREAHDPYTLTRYHGTEMKWEEGMCVRARQVAKIMFHIQHDSSLLYRRDKQIQGEYIFSDLTAELGDELLSLHPEHSS